MYNQRTLYRVFILLFITILHCGTGYGQPRKFSFSRNKMGSPFNLLFITDDSARAAVLAERCFALVDSFNHLFSDYDSTSELNALNSRAGTDVPFKVSPLLWDIIDQSRKAYRRSENSFDITIGALSQVWRKVRKSREFPSATSIAAAKNKVGFRKLVIDSTQHTILLPAGMRLDLGGIAKGYVAQELIGFLRQQGITQALADAGGDMAMSDGPPGTKGWTVGVNVPETTDELLPKKLLLRNIAVATSGDAYQFLEYHGKKYSHIIDPRTGYGITSQRNVTVIAPDGATADWLATACSILPITEAKKIALKNGAELLITELKDGKIEFHNTEHFADFWKH